MGTIKCVFLKSIFKASNDSGYGVNLYRFVNGDDDGGAMKKNKVFTAAGNSLHNSPGTTATLEGEWIEGKYGRQFQVSASTHEVSTEKGVKAYLARLGFDIRQASVIWKNYGKDTLKVLDQGKEPLIAIGINAAKAEACLERHGEERGTKDAIVLLGAFGLKQKTALKIADKLKEKTEYVIKEHPYRLIDFREISFGMCETLAKEHGADQTSIERTCAGVIQALVDAEKSGNTGIPASSIVDKTTRITGADDKIAKALALLCEQQKVVKNGGLFQRKITSDVEWNIARRIAELSAAVSDIIPDIDEKITIWEKQNGFTLATQQREAVICSLTHSFSVITGGPGRGKTTIAKCITDLRKKYGSKDSRTVCMMAPTGRASKKLQESTGEPSSTTHSRIGIRESEFLNVEAEETIKDATIICDEGSMLDIWVMNAVISNVENGTQLTIVGDIDQLPSVGAGAVLRDIIDSECVPVVRLTEIFRQKGESKIITNAEKIRTGDAELEYDKTSFTLYHAEDFVTSAKYMIALYKENVAKYGREEVCLLSPHHHAKTESSVDMLNKYIQYYTNPSIAGVEELEHRGTTYRFGDLVMNTKNIEGVANGDIGVVKEVKFRDGKKGLSIVFENITKDYFGEELDYLELGYAMSIHKSQGSEYKCVILNLLCEHGVMLKRNLLYTAVTRAKQHCILVSNKAAITKAILTEETNRRKTRLKEKTQFVFKKQLEEVPFPMAS